MPRKQEYTAQQIIDALRDARGIKSIAARNIGTTRTTIDNYCKRYPTVQEAFDTAWDVIIDDAESALLVKLDAGDMAAINKVLNEKGRSRGWGTAKGTAEDPLHENHNVTVTIINSKTDA